MLHHFKRTMPEQGLQREDVATGPKIRKCECLAEAIGVTLGNSCPLSQPGDQLPEHTIIKAPVEPTHKRGRLATFSSLAFGQVTPQTSLCHFAPEDCSSLAIFSAAAGIAPQGETP